MSLGTLPPLIPNTTDPNGQSVTWFQGVNSSISTSTNNSSSSPVIWVGAAILYSVVGQFMGTKALAGLSFLLVMGALFVNNRSGHNVITDLGL
jgi:hypothetical protein